MDKTRECVRLDGEKTTLVLALVKGGAANLLYLGRALLIDEDLAAIAASQARGRHESQADNPPSPGLLPERKDGWNGTPAAELVSDGRALDTDFRLVGWELTEAAISLRYEDELLGVAIIQEIAARAGDAFATRAEISAEQEDDFILTRLASLVLPVPARFTEVTTYSGRWAGEMRETRRTIAPDGVVKRTATGKPGFEAGHWLKLHDPETDEALGAHLRWSGDHELFLEPDSQGASDGRATLLMGARWDMGEVRLASGHPFATPEAVFCLGASEDALGQAFHRFARAHTLPNRDQWSERKVHINTWEALGFNLSEGALTDLAEAAANIGVERFVLDDGWFANRRDDTKSLGDWSPSPPIGLAHVIDAVKALGMDFGLWIEPEMVSPDSELYRAHPEWCLHVVGRNRSTMRGQLVLDLTLRDVRQYLHRCFDTLLENGKIAYLKWDHNRDLFPTAGKRFAQTEALYGLMDDVRSRHSVAIETCASGGGRIDFGILRHCERVWPSDNTDAIERVRIIRAWSQFLPLEVLGSHVGPSPNPITGRRLTMDFRAKIAMFGHMGVETDPRSMNEADRAVLAAHIALYKRWRGLLHNGDLTRLEHPDPGISGLMVTHQNQGLAMVAQTGFSAPFDAAPVRLVGLDPQSLYRVTLPEPWPARASLYLAKPGQWRDGLILSGGALMTQGIALPLTHPETAWLIALERQPS
ncbi:MAG: alpha-galactosidase [Pseudomonadota bacterium]